MLESILSKLNLEGVRRRINELRLSKKYLSRKNNYD